MSRRALAMFVAMCVIWGIPYLFIRIAVRELEPAELVFARTALGAAILLPIAISRGAVWPALKLWKPLIVFAALEIGIPWLALATAEQHISSSLAGLLISAVPLVTMAAAFVLGSREQLGPLNVVGLIVGMLGVAAIAGIDFSTTGVVPLLEMAAVVVGYSVAPVVLSRFMRDAPPVGVTSSALTLCAIAYAPFALLHVPASLPSTGAIASVLMLAIVCTAIAFLLFFTLINEVGPVRATVITYINPAVAAVLGVLVLRETFTLGMAVGFVLVLVGSALATRRARSGPVPLDDHHPALAGAGVDAVDDVVLRD
jgi:drug/metabolite transporter (DMT)-like permease